MLLSFLDVQQGCLTASDQCVVEHVCSHMCHCQAAVKPSHSALPLAITEEHPKKEPPVCWVFV